jgi:hypothetical protein
MARPTTTTACSRPYRPEFEYDCSAGHAIGSSSPVPACPAVVRGVPCPGVLRRVGKGSRSIVAPNG